MLHMFYRSKCFLLNLKKACSNSRKKNLTNPQLYIHITGIFYSIFVHSSPNLTILLTAQAEVNPVQAVQTCLPLTLNAL